MTEKEIWSKIIEEANSILESERLSESYLKKFVIDFETLSEVIAYKISNDLGNKDSDEIFIHDLSGKLSNNIRIEGFLSNRGVYSFIENSKISDFIDENDLTDKTYLPFSIISIGYFLV